MAAEAGVKLFIPCEYTLEFAECETSPHEKGKIPTVEDMAKEAYPLVKLRREAVALCKDLGMPCLQVHTGISPEEYWGDSSSAHTFRDHTGKLPH